MVKDSRVGDYFRLKKELEEKKSELSRLEYEYNSIINQEPYMQGRLKSRQHTLHKLRGEIKSLEKEINDMVKIKDCMDILKLSGFIAQDEDPRVKSLTYKGYTIRYRPSSGKYYISSGPGDTVSLKHIGKEYANLNEAKYSISHNDGCPVFTKGSKDATTYKPGDRVTIAGGYSARIMSENNGTYIAQLPSGKKIELIANEILSKDDDATEKGSIEQYGKGTETESMGLSDDPVLAQDGLSNWEKRQDWLEEQIRKLSKYGDRYTQQKLRAYKEEYDAITRRLSSTKDQVQANDASYPVKYKGYTIKKDFKGDLKVYDKSGAVLAQDFYSVEQAKKAIDKREEMINSRGAKDSDPKVAEANAIINLCGGVM